MGFLDGVLKYGWIAPILCQLIGLCTIIACIITSKVNGSNWGGLPFPYISDTGKDKPEYYVFAIGLTITGFLLWCVSFIDAVYFKKMDLETPHVERLGIPLLIFGFIAGIGLALLSIFDTVHYPNLHLYSAIIAIVCLILWCTMDLTATWLIFHETKDSNCKYNAICKTVIMIVVYIAFIIYIPVGLAVICPWVQDANGNYDYSGCLGLHLMRSISQYVTVFLLLIYIGFVKVSNEPRQKNFV